MRLSVLERPPRHGGEPIKKRGSKRIEDQGWSVGTGKSYDVELHSLQKPVRKNQVRSAKKKTGRIAQEPG